MLGQSGSSLGILKFHSRNDGRIESVSSREVVSEKRDRSSVIAALFSFFVRFLIVMYKKLLEMYKTPK